MNEEDDIAPCDLAALDVLGEVADEMAKSLAISIDDKIMKDLHEFAHTVVDWAERAGIVSEEKLAMLDEADKVDAYDRAMEVFDD